MKPEMMPLLAILAWIIYYISVRKIIILFNHSSKDLIIVT
jgi:hypothetical protein